MAPLSLQLFGGFPLRRDSRRLAVPAKKAQALLAYLALSAARSCTTTDRRAHIAATANASAPTAPARIDG
jgi:hypothetical protein